MSAAPRKLHTYQLTDCCFGEYRCPMALAFALQAVACHNVRLKVTVMLVIAHKQAAWSYQRLHACVVSSSLFTGLLYCGLRHRGIGLPAQ